MTVSHIPFGARTDSTDSLPRTRQNHLVGIHDSVNGYERTSYSTQEAHNHWTRAARRWRRASLPNATVLNPPYQAIRSGCERELSSAEVGVVSRSGLGTLNHTALTVEALRRRDVPVHGIVLNRYEGETVAERTNPDVLQTMTDLAVWRLREFSIESPDDVVEACRRELPREAVATLECGAITSGD